MLVLFAVAMFVAATLLFLVQPMFASMVLPLLGGSPSVWNTTAMFFRWRCWLAMVTRTLCEPA